MNKFSKRLRKTNALRVIVFILFLCYALSLIFPLVWGFISSLKEPTEYMLSEKFFPEIPLFSNYIEAFKLLEANDSNLFTMLFNTVWLSFGRTFISIMVASATAYVIARFEFVGRNFIYNLAIVTMILPIFGNLASTVKIYKALHMYDSPLILLASAGGFGLVFLVMHSYYKTIPKEYAEAAQMDGANQYYIYFKIMFPMAKSSVFSLALVAFIDAWNDYATSIYYLPSFPTISSGLYTYSTVTEFNLNYPAYFAGMFLACIVPLALYIAFQDIIMKGISTGGLKG
ncbi:MAG: carbohydrate ABC transporter permease [Alphaproteobacteria bacterium]|nr:carbohydrate ABC transporter permease [Alphaproteobacteria bacterium]